MAQAWSPLIVKVERFTLEVEVGQYRFTTATVAQVTIRGAIDLELRALRWLLGSRRPRSGSIADGQSCLEARIGRPVTHGTEYFKILVQRPIRRF